MSILDNKSTKVIAQGVTGAIGTFHADQALACGAPIGATVPLTAAGAVPIYTYPV